ncbi:MAG: DUF2304 domain-containing protein [Nanoarchaeota archaeon]|nr:DUF2304 domain-containing protein [Nanoarchaeota archaeon]
MIAGIQIAGVLFAIFMLYLTFLHQKRKEFTVKEYLFWVGLWLVFVLLALFPTALDPFVKGVLNVKRPIDLFMILGFMLIMGMIFHIYTIMRRVQKRSEEIVRKMAMRKR